MSEAVKFDAHKAPLSLIDPVFTEQVARVLAHGEAKYGKSNWRGLMVERLLDAVKRHILEIEKGNDYDEETGLPHAAHAASGLMFINWLTVNRPNQDDRRWANPRVPPVPQSPGGRLHPESSGETGLDLSSVHPAEQAPKAQQEATRRYSEGSIADVQRAITEWADRTFPNRTVEEAIKKLKKEIAELEVSGHTDAGEFADVAILLFDIAYLQGIDLRRAVANKMIINEGRTWEQLADGTHQHVGEL